MNDYFAGLMRRTGLRVGAGLEGADAAGTRADTPLVDPAAPEPKGAELLEPLEIEEFREVGQAPVPDRGPEPSRSSPPPSGVTSAGEAVAERESPRDRGVPDAGSPDVPTSAPSVPDPGEQKAGVRSRQVLDGTGLEVEARAQAPERIEAGVAGPWPSPPAPVPASDPVEAGTHRAGTPGPVPTRAPAPRGHQASRKAEMTDPSPPRGPTPARSLIEEQAWRSAYRQVRNWVSARPEQGVAARSKDVAAAAMKQIRTQTLEQLERVTETVAPEPEAASECPPQTVTKYRDLKVSIGRLEVSLEPPSRPEPPRRRSADERPASRSEDGSSGRLRRHFLGP